MLRLFVLTSITACAFGEVVPQLDGRIVGGEPTTIEEFPYQISLNYGRQHICGGSIISETVVVTAAHCVVGTPIGSLVVQAGATSLHSDKGVRIAIKQAIPHEDYDRKTKNNDIALLILAEPLPFCDSIKPIDLPEPGEEAKVGAVAYTSGWGHLLEGGPGSDVLQYVAVNIIDSQKCNEAYQKGGANISASMICAGVPEGGKDACQGDSGGPLLSGIKLVGVVSWGFGCARKEYPGVYSSVSYFRDWIEKNRTDK